MAKRKKPVSAKQKKLYLQEKRAAKRGDPPVHPVASAALALKTRYRPGTSNSPRPEKGLISRFSGLSQAYINASKTTALTRPLPRPLPEGSATFPVELIEASRGKRGMTVPRRPKWRYEMTKKEVEMNEEGVFKKWLDGCDGVIAEWREEGEEIERKKKEIEKRKLKGEEIPEEEQMGTDEEGFDWPRSTVFFERNLQVWRQLWRTTEMSSILLVLIDIRCPPLHFPPSLQEYISSLQPRKEVIIVLTKCDLISEPVKDAWVKWCKQEWEEKKGWEVVEVESYRREARKQGTKAALKSHLPPASLTALLSALQRAHSKLLTPPHAVSSDPTKLANWKPRVRSDIDWDALRRGEGGDAPVIDARQLEEDDDQELFARDNDGEADHGDTQRTTEQEAEWERKRLEFLTIGLIGQPNVGKSSLLNALVGSSKVRASKTPGKTKHFQTIFWSPQIRLCDTPGLVLPSLTPYELQAISSILPISHIPALPSVLRLAGCLMPLEKVLGLGKVVDEEEEERERRKTTRTSAAGGGAGVKKEVEKVESWTTGEIMEGWADERGFVTAKAGRPDLNRAGNHILRAIAESRISWSFLPPVSNPASDSPTPAPTLASEIIPTSQGIWLGERAKVVYESSEEEESSELESTEDEESDSEEEEGQEEEDGEDEEEERVVKTAGVGSMFGALEIEGGEDASDEESESEEEEEASDEEEG